MTSDELNIDDLPAAFPEWLARIPAGMGSTGWQVAAASMLESAVCKPGNVHPGARFADLCHDDFLAAALAIAEPFSDADRLSGNCHTPPAGESVGHLILAAVEAAARVTQSNTNLGIVLAIAPLAVAHEPRQDAAAEVLASLDAEDAAAIWKAIAVARPGGLGQVHRHDLAGPAPSNIIDAMRVARDRDAIARLWADGYKPLFSTESLRPGMVPLLEQAVAENATVGKAIQEAFLQHLALHHDSLIARRHGLDVAHEVSAEASMILSLPRSRQAAAIQTFDATLRLGRLVEGRHRPINPGTTADLMAASLFVLLRRGWRLQTTPDGVSARADRADRPAPDSTIYRRATP
jgi:triphosphoribosyl-dephospho-CoA synthase